MGQRCRVGGTRAPHTFPPIPFPNTHLDPGKCPKHGTPPIPPLRNGVHVNSKENARQSDGQGQWEPPRLTNNPREPCPRRKGHLGALTPAPGGRNPWPYKGPSVVKTSVSAPPQASRTR